MSFIFIIDDDKALCRSLEIQLEGVGHQAQNVNTIKDGLAALEDLTPDLILLDLGLPDGNGIDALRDFRARDYRSPVVIVTGQQDMKATIEAMRLGAFDYIRKPFDIDDVLLVIEKINRFQSITKEKTSSTEAGLSRPDSQSATYDKPCEIVGSHKVILDVIKQIGLLSTNRITVLIEGESGTGKELVARALHEAATPSNPFVAINCSAVVPTLPESELFGHEKGSFTGADAQKKGKLEFAGTGTVFFDEIGDMPLDLQAKVLRVFQERNFERVGGLTTIPFKARVIAASNRNLEDLVKKNRFRQDLYYRLAVAKIVIPPLRERRTDIPDLVHHFIKLLGCSLHRNIKAIEDKAMRRLESYDWPGNVRELENVLTRAVALSLNPELLSDEDVEFSLSGVAKDIPDPTAIKPLYMAEKEHIEKALIATGWNITHTASSLEISPTTLRKKISDFGLKNPK